MRRAPTPAAASPTLLAATGTTSAPISSTGRRPTATARSSSRTPRPVVAHRPSGDNTSTCSTSQHATATRTTRRRPGTTTSSVAQARRHRARRGRRRPHELGRDPRPHERGVLDVVYNNETPYYLDYLGTDHDDPDSDGDGVRDGADDWTTTTSRTMESSRLRRLRAVGRGARRARRTRMPPKPPDTNHASEYGRVNPFNPCLPNRQVRARASAYITGERRARGHRSTSRRVLPDQELASATQLLPVAPRPAIRRASVVS